MGGKDRGNSIGVVVDDAGAKYPITVDPMAQQAYLKASNAGAEDGFGYSVAVSGGTVVVDVQTGSAFGHLASAADCDCADRRFRGVICKHMIAVRKAEGRETCPDCGAYRIHRLYYIGGRGYCGFMCCSANNEHKARPIV